MCNPILPKGQQFNTATSLDEEASDHAKKKMRTLTEDELSLKMVQMQHSASEWITRALSSNEDEFEIINHEGSIKVKNNNQSIKYSVEHELYLGIEYTTESGEFKNKIPESNLPKHHCFNLLVTEQFVEPVLCRSMRIDENIVADRLCHKIPKLSIIACEKENPDTKFCLHAPMCGIALASFRQDQPGIKYLATAGLACCHAIIFWDSTNQVATMSHFMQKDMCPEAFDLMLASMSYRDPSNLRMYIIGGHTHRMTHFPGFFNFIEEYVKSKNIYIHQTFLGNHGGRPSDVIFDVEDGTLFELAVKENLTTHKLDSFDASTLNHGEEVCFRTKSNREVKYRFTSEKNRSLLIPVIAELSG